MKKKYIGIDIGKKSCSACVKDTSGKIIFEITYPNAINVVSLTNIRSDYPYLEIVFHDCNITWNTTY